MITDKDLYDRVDTILEIIKENRKNISPRMNLLDITGSSHLEVKNSNIIAFLLDPNAPHKQPEIGSLFLRHLKRKLPDSIQGTAIRRVRREQITGAGRFIDLFLETDICEFIIIENKVGAGDLNDQLKDYIKWVQDTFEKHPISVYLTPHGNLPSDHSLEKIMREDMEDRGRFLCLSYQHDIISWLDEILFTISNDSGNDLLRSAIVQYKDAVNGFCGQRKEDVMEQSKIVEDLIQHYGLGLNSQGTIKDLQTVASSFLSAIEQIAIMQFLIELRFLLKQNRKDRVNLTLDQVRYSDTDLWIEACKKGFGNMGIELALEESDLELQYGVGLEFSEPTRRASIYFGLMTHGSGSHFKTPRISIPKKHLEDLGSISQSDNAWWGQCSTVGQWFNQALFLYGVDAKWQDSRGSLVNHVAKWFLIEDWQD